MPVKQTERSKHFLANIQFDVVSRPELDPDTLMTIYDLLNSLPDDAFREQARASLSHRVGDFLTHPAHASRVSTPLASFAGAADKSADKNANCGRVSWRGAFARQEAGDAASCPHLSPLTSHLSPLTSHLSPQPHPKHLASHHSLTHLSQVRARRRPLPLQASGRSGLLSCCWARAVGDAGE